MPTESPAATGAEHPQAEKKIQCTKLKTPSKHESTGGTERPYRITRWTHETAALLTFLLIYFYFTTQMRGGGRL